MKASLSTENLAGSDESSSQNDTPVNPVNPINPNLPTTFEHEDDESEGVSGSNISDQPSDIDTLGFDPYVTALAKFLLDKKTKGPLTMSIEGEWGSGKSSFMLQLARKLRDPGSYDDQYDPAEEQPFIIQFNAWRYDKEDAMWAAFALQLIEGLAAQTSSRKRIRSRLWLLLHQYNWKKGWWDLLVLCLGGPLVIMALIFLSYLLITKSSSEIYSVFLSEHATSNMLSIALSLGGFGAVLIGGAIVWKFRKLFKIPFAVDLRRHIDVPDYKTRGSFIEDFHKDFSNVITAYAGEDKKQDKEKTAEAKPAENAGAAGSKKQKENEAKAKAARPRLSRRMFLSIEGRLKVQNPRKVFVFIDDLDRCDIPKSADLMQSLNLMISESSQLFFIMGMDREKVAAGLAVKYEKILPYIAAAPAPTGQEQPAPNGPDYFMGLEYGYNFIEKFIQVPFKVPQPSSDNIKSLVNSFSEEEENAAAGGAPAAASQEPDSMIVELKKTDSKVVKEIVSMVASTFDYNPRRIKQFLNLFRLKAYIASQTGLFAEPDDPGYERLTLEKLGKFVALTLRYPLLISDLDDKPDLLSELQYHAWGTYSFNNKIVTRWVAKSKINELLNKGFEGEKFEFLRNSEMFDEKSQPPKDSDERLKFSMTEMDISKLLQVSPAKIRPERKTAPDAEPPPEVKEASGEMTMDVDHIVPAPVVETPSESVTDNITREAEAAPSAKKSSGPRKARPGAREAERDPANAGKSTKPKVSIKNARPK